MLIMNTSRILLLAASCALAAPAWAGAGLTSAGIDPNANTNTAQNEPTLAQVAPVQNGASGATAGTVAVPAGTSAAVPNIAGAAGSNPGNPNADPRAAGGTTVVAAPPPAPPPPPPDPSTLPVSVIRPVNKTPAATAAAPTAVQNAPTSETAAGSGEKTERRAAAPPATPSQSPVNAPAPTPAPPRPMPSGNARTDAGQLTSNKSVAAAPVTTPGATADGSANGYVFYMGSAIAGIILAFAFASYLRGGGGKPGA